MGFYNRHIAPRLVSAVCGSRLVERQRGEVVPHARGRVLEVGLGSGHNLRFYDPDKVELLWALEPDATMRALAQPRLAGLPFEVRFLDLPGEEIPLDDAAVDTVLTTFTLCTIPDSGKALAQMRRVLKPGGTLLFCEHGESPDAGVLRMQQRIEPVWKRLAGGCHLTRPIPALIEASGFATRDVHAGYMHKWFERAYVPAALKISAFEYRGTATPR